MVAKICMLVIFVGVAVGVGIYCRRNTFSVDGFVLGGRNVGPWMSAFAYGTSYFSAVVFGTDSPWEWTEDYLVRLAHVGFTEEELRAILYENAAGLLGL